MNDTTAGALDEPHPDLHHRLVLHRLVRRAERHGHVREAPDVAREHEVGLVGRDDAQRATPAEFVLDGAPEMDLETRLPDVAMEQLDADRPRTGGHGRSRAGELIAARKERQHEHEAETLHATRLTSRPGTTT